MGIKIDKIAVKNLGPINEFSGELGLLNLIYSKNEKGKTFLTEFIIRSLFKNIKRWGYLRETGEGRVILNGLEDSPTEFSPSFKKKLEDFWERDERGLPPSLAKLLVVKGGEAKIVEEEGGISKLLIKEVLFGEKLLDEIDSDANISKTVKRAQIRDTQIDIVNQGEGKEYHGAKEELNKIRQLLAEVESQYAQGALKTCKIGKKDLQNQLGRLSEAKRHKAYLISEKIKNLEEELNKVPEDELDDIRTNLFLYRNEQGNYSKLKRECEDAQKNSRAFAWLQKALPRYENLIAEGSQKPNDTLLLLGAVLAVTAVLLFFVDQKLAGTALFLALGIIIGIHIRKLNGALEHVGESKELHRIKSEFRKRTSRELTDIALMESVLEEQREFNSGSKTIKRQLEGQDRKLIERHSDIQTGLSSLIGVRAEELRWDAIFKELKEKHRSLKNQIDNKRGALLRLDVDEMDYLQEDVGIEYGQEKYESAKSELESVQEKIEEQEGQLRDLRYEISQKTGDPTSLSWEELMDNLHKKKEETQKELRKAAAKIVAGVSVHNVISQLREEEDIKIQEGLESEEVLRPLRELTRRYNKLTLEGEALKVSDEYSNFDLRDLSTGAREQIMLALRLGFSSKLLKQNTGFLVLDDAFQRCDWEKREILVKNLANVAKKGWQIIYLTMDDHIRRLFNKVGRGFGKSAYKSLELGGA